MATIGKHQNVIPLMDAQSKTSTRMFTARHRKHVTIGLQSLNLNDHQLSLLWAQCWYVYSDLYASKDPAQSKVFKSFDHLSRVRQARLSRQSENAS